MIQIGNKFGHFQIQGEIGKGGMGTIYHAVDLMLNREVALKVIHPQYADNTQLMERFKIEAMTQARMNHPSIVMIFSFTKIENEFVIAMEYIAGKSLKELLREKQCFSVEEAISYLLQILDGLKYSHSLNVIHRDIKPANILVTAANRIKISDFGIAKVFGVEGMTKTGILVGTPWYTSPEQILGKDIDFRADLYSLGVTFFEMVTGRVPFDSSNNSEFQVQKAHLEMQPPRPSQINPAISAEVERFILKTLQKKPEKRFQNAGEMLQAVQALLSPRPQSLPEPLTGDAVMRETPTTLIRQQRRSVTPIKTVGISIVLLSLILVGGYFLGLFGPVKLGRTETTTPASGIEQQQGIPEEKQKTQEDMAQPRNDSAKIGLVGPLVDGASTQLPRDLKDTTTSQPATSSPIPISPGNRLSLEQESPQKEQSGQGQNSSQSKDGQREPISKTGLAGTDTADLKDGKTVLPPAETGKKPAAAEPAQAQRSPPQFDVKLEISQFTGLINRKEVTKALDRAEEIYSQLDTPQLYPWIGYLNFLAGRFERAEQFFVKTLSNNMSIEIQVAHMHDDDSACLGVLRLSRQVLMFSSRNETLHSFRYTFAQIGQVERRKERLMMELGGEPGRYFRILNGINDTDAEREKFLVSIINRYIKR